MIQEVLNAFETSINTQHWSQSFLCEQSVRPLSDMRTLGQMKVSLMVKDVQTKNISRAKSIHEIEIDVCVQKKLSTLFEQESIDLFGLLEQIRDFYIYKNVSGYLIYKAEITFLYDHEMIEQNKLFWGVVSFWLKL